MKKNKRKKPKPYYELAEVKSLIKEGKVLIRKNAIKGADVSFGWETVDILDALNNLENKHFYKSAVSNKLKSSTVLDFYKAKNLKGENIYIHYYINDDEGMLIVNSFKQLK